MTRTGWLSVLALAALALGTFRALQWPSAAPALECEPADIRWVDAGTSLVAVCAPSSAPGTVPVGQALTLGVKLDLNRVGEESLAMVSGIGPSLARALVAARPDGGFRTWEEVDAVRGMGPAKLEALQRATELRP